MTAVMTLEWKAAMPKITRAIWVHSDIMWDTAILLKMLLLFLLAGVGKAKEKRMFIQTQLWHLMM